MSASDLKRTAKRPLHYNYFSAQNILENDIDIRSGTTTHEIITAPVRGDCAKKTEDPTQTEQEHDGHRRKCFPSNPRPTNYSSQPQSFKVPTHPFNRVPLSIRPQSTVPGDTDPSYRHIAKDPYPSSTQADLEHQSLVEGTDSEYIEDWDTFTMHPDTAMLKKEAPRAPVSTKQNQEADAIPNYEVIASGLQTEEEYGLYLESEMDKLDQFFEPMYDLFQQKENYKNSRPLWKDPQDAVILSGYNGEQDASVKASDKLNATEPPLDLNYMSQDNMEFDWGKSTFVPLQPLMNQQVSYYPVTVDNYSANVGFMNPSLPMNLEQNNLLGFSPNGHPMQMQIPYAPSGNYMHMPAQSQNLSFGYQGLPYSAIPLSSTLLPPGQQIHRRYTSAQTLRARNPPKKRAAES